MAIGLQLRFYMLIAAMFAVVYLVIVMIGAAMGIASFTVYFGIGIVMMLIQYLIGPSMTTKLMKIKYVTKEEEPKLHSMIEEMSIRANLPMPKIGISEMPIPNAFAFGRSIKDGRVCVTKGILSLLSEKELKAVLGHELTHIKNHDMAFMTFMSVIPMSLYYLAISSMYSRSDRGNSGLIGFAALILYFITNLLVLYGSRIREYYADKGSVSLGNNPHNLASALYKLTYGSANSSKRAIQQVSGYKAFFANDPSRALDEFKNLKSLDKDLSGDIDQSELEAIRHKKIKLSFGEKAVELLGTHPNMVKRVKHLSEMRT